MKKNLVVLAACLCAGGVSAQSSVVLFGVVDAAISHYSTKSSYYGTSASALLPELLLSTERRSQTVLSTNGYNSSRLGFRGTEDLGGGLAASFWLESPVVNDTGGTVGSFARRSTVSFSGPFGELRAGRDYTATFWNDSVFDPFTANGVGASLIYLAAANLSTLRGPGGVAPTDNYLRTSNSIGYLLPADLGGLYGQVQYTLHENARVSDMPASSTERGKYVGGRFGYMAGALDVAVAYGENTAADATLPTGAATSDKIRTFNLGASYDFGPVKLFGEISRVRDRMANVSAIASGGLQTRLSDHYDGALVGLTVPVGVGLIRAAYSDVRFRSGLGEMGNLILGRTNGGDASTSKLALGYVHNLSKRTALYATASWTRIRDGQNNPAVMGINAGGPSGSLPAGSVNGFRSTGNGVAGYAPRSAAGYDFGIRHAF